MSGDNNEMSRLANEMAKAISTAVEERYIMEEAKLEAVLRANGWVKAEEIFVEIMLAIEQGESNADIRIKDLAPHTYKVMMGAGKVYAGEIGKAICEVFKKRNTQKNNGGWE